MSAQPATNEAVQWAIEQHANFEPNSRVKRNIAHISLGMLIGPTSIGKSHLINEVIRQDPQFSGMGTITNRDKRPDDPNNYQFVTTDEFIDKIKSGELVQYEIHSHTGDFYGSDADSYKTELVVAPVLSRGVKAFELAGFKDTTPIGIVASGTDWQQRLPERSSEATFVNRLNEALEVIDWLQRRYHDIPILENRSDRTAETAQKIRQLTVDGFSWQDIFESTGAVGQMIEMKKVAEHKLEVLGE